MISETNINIEQNKNNSGWSQVGAFFWDLFKILVLAFIITAPFRLFVAEPFVVSGSSMTPNFHDKDYLIVDRISFRSSLPQRGDVVVFKYPKDPSEYFIKRIIGLPGEEVKLQQGHVAIFNREHPEGFRLAEPYLPAQVQTLGRSEPVSLGDEQYFVLGDNRTASSDSRVWGILPQSDIVGKVWIRVFPLGDFGRIATPTFNN